MLHLPQKDLANNVFSSLVLLKTNKKNIITKNITNIINSFVEVKSL